MYQVRFDSAAFGGVSRETFVRAMRAEGIPVSAGYGMSLDRQGVFANKRFDLLATQYDPAYAPTKYGELELPHTQRLCEEAIWIPHNVLLAEPHDIEDVATAAAKVRASAARLAETT